MSNLVCFSHKEYNGTTAPVISCKTCCSIFILAVKKQQEEGRDVDYSRMSLEDTGLSRKRNQIQN